ncbi:MAG: hypothetical protein U0835_22460 [Isosphaeraceae bacterium]
MPTMPESVSLHVQARDSQTIRVVEVRGGTARIGRAPYCEVRLNDPDVPHEACRLRRQGSVWMLVPGGSRSSACVLVEFEPLDEPRPLPVGVPFRVGPYRLSLEAAETSEPSWGAREVPRIQPVEPQGATVETSRVAESSWAAEAVSPAAPAPKPAAPRPEAGWGSREPSQDRWTRQEEQARRWESRFRAVGEKLRASSRPPVEPPPAAPDASTWRGARTSSEVPRREMKRPARPVPGIPPVAPGVPRVEPVPRSAAPARSRPAPVSHALHRPTPFEPAVGAVPPPPRPSLVPVPELPAGVTLPPRPSVATRLPRTTERLVRSREQPEVRRPAEIDPQALVETPPAVPAAEEVVETQPADVVVSPPLNSEFDELPETEFHDREEVSSSPDDLDDFDDEDRYVEEDQPARFTLGSTRRAPLFPEGASVACLEANPSEIDELDGAEQPVKAFSPEVDEATQWSAPVETFEAEPAIEPVAEASVATTPSPEPVAPAAEEPSEGWACPEPIVADTTFGTGPAWADATPIVEATEPGVDWRGWSQPTGGESARLRADAPEPGRAGVSRNAIGGPRGTPRDLPTVADIMAASTPRAGRRPGRPPEKRADAASRPLPTGSKRRGSGTCPVDRLAPEPRRRSSWREVGCFAAWTWTRDAYNAGIVVARLGQAEPGRSRPAGVAPGRSTWWASQASHLLEWAVYLDRTATEPGQVTEAKALLDRASEVSPLHTGVRYTMARPMPGDREAPGLTRALGQSRDVLALAWSGRRLLASGKKDAALRAYAAALEMASTADLAGMGSPTFLDDTETRRYALPAEDVVGTVIRDMAEQSEWSYAEWSAAVPRGTVAPVVAARVLREPRRERGRDRAGRRAEGCCRTAEGDRARGGRAPGRPGRGPGNARPLGRRPGPLPAGDRPHAVRRAPPVVVDEPGGDRPPPERGAAAAEGPRHGQERRHEGRDHGPGRRTPEGGRSGRPPHRPADGPCDGREALSGEAAGERTPPARSAPDW